MASGENAMNKSIVFQWYRRFKNVREGVTADTRSGQPEATITGINIARV